MFTWFPEGGRSVGTSQEWIRVLEMGGMFGAAMLLMDALIQREKAFTWSNLFATAIASFMFGMMFVFEWRVLHTGIAVLFFGALLMILGVGFAARRARKRTESALKTR